MICIFKSQNNDQQEWKVAPASNVMIPTMPRAFYNGGYIFAPVMMVLIGIYSLVCSFSFHPACIVFLSATGLFWVIFSQLFLMGLDFPSYFIFFSIPNLHFSSLQVCTTLLVQCCQKIHGPCGYVASLLLCISVYFTFWVSLSFAIPLHIPSCIFCFRLAGSLAHQTTSQSSCKDTYSGVLTPAQLPAYIPAPADNTPTCAHIHTHRHPIFRTSMPLLCLFPPRFFISWTAIPPSGFRTWARWPADRGSPGLSRWAKIVSYFELKTLLARRFFFSPHIWVWFLMRIHKTNCAFITDPIPPFLTNHADHTYRPQRPPRGGA